MSKTSIRPAFAVLHTPLVRSGQRNERPCLLSKRNPAMMKPGPRKVTAEAIIVHCRALSSS